MGNWDPKSEKCLMRLESDGTYSIIFKKLPAGKYEFKVTDGTWNNAWGTNGDNFKFDLSETKNVLIRFTPNNGQGQIEVVFNPGTDDFPLYIPLAAVLCVTVCGCLLLMNKKKLI
jgi:hypothetical protein